VRILYVHRTAGARVEGVHIREIAKALTRLGHEVSLFNPPGCDPMRHADDEAHATESKSSGALRGFIGRLPRLVHPFLFELLEIAYSVCIVPFVAWRIWRFRPQLIYERTSTCQFAATLTGGWFNVPVMQEINQTLDIGRLRKVYLLRLARALERWVFKRSAALLTVSTRFKDMLVERGYDASKIHVIANAADPERFSPELAPSTDIVAPPDGAVVIGYVGGFLIWHSLERFIDLVKQTGPTGVTLMAMLIGDGPERPRLEQRAAAQGVSDRIVFTGAVSHDRLPAVIQRLDIAVMTNATEYASPVKMFEYLAMGKAIVAPRVPPITEILTDGETGVFFDPDSPKSLGPAVMRVVADPELRARLGRNARQLALRRHTWMRNAERILDIARSFTFADKE